LTPQPENRLVQANLPTHYHVGVCAPHYVLLKPRFCAYEALGR